MTHPCDSLLSLTLVVGKSVYLKICSRIFCMLMTSTIYKYICKQKPVHFNFSKYLSKYEFDDSSRVKMIGAIAIIAIIAIIVIVVIISIIAITITIIAITIAIIFLLSWFPRRGCLCGGRR